MRESSALGEWRSHWPLALAAALGYSVAVLHTYSIGVFIAPLQEEFGWSRSFISLGITTAGVMAAVFSLPVGMAVDRFGPRPVAIVGVMLMCGSIALLGTASGTTANWLLLWVIVGFGNLGLQVTVWTSALATRFERSRGLAFAR
jgi:MFS family permease